MTAKAKYIYARNLLIKDGFNTSVEIKSTSDIIADAMYRKIIHAIANHGDGGLTQAATLIGSKGGQAKTAAKIRAAQENGKKGGRPKKKNPPAADSPFP